MDNKRSALHSDISELNWSQGPLPWVYDIHGDKQFLPVVEQSPPVQQPKSSETQPKAETPGEIILAHPTPIAVTPIRGIQIRDEAVSAKQFYAEICTLHDEEELSAACAVLMNTSAVDAFKKEQVRGMLWDYVGGTPYWDKDSGKYLEKLNDSKKSEIAAFEQRRKVYWSLEKLTSAPDSVQVEFIKAAISRRRENQKWRENV